VYDMTKANRTKTADQNADARTEADSTATAVAAEQAEGELVYLPLNKLDFDSDNVRKRGGENVDALKALILSQDLLQNLVVCPQLTKRGKPTGKFGVIAGGRRLRALRALAEEGKIASDKEILCLIKPREQATLTSAAENSGREAMTGPDTIIAFAKMVRDGKGVEELALAFGISEITVRRRLKLANVSPKLFELYAQEQISLDQLMGLAVIDDHERQEAVWEGASEYQRSGAQLKRAALGQAVSAASDRLARFVGVEVYTAAGGQVAGDLFTDNDQGYFTDPELLARLAGEKLAAERQQLLGAGVAWVDVIDEYDYTERQKYVEAPTSKREPTKREKKVIDAARTKLAVAEQAMQAYQDEDTEGEEGDEERYDALEMAVDDAQGDVDELLSQLKTVSPDVQALCGVVLTVEPTGQLRAHRNLVRKQDAKKATSVARQSDSGSDGGSDGSSAPAEEDTGTGLSEALLGRLAAQRSIALQVEVARNHHVALAVLAATLLPELGIGGDSYHYSSVTARNRDADFTLADPSVKSGKAWAEMAALIGAAESEVPQDGDGALPWLIAQPMEVLVRILALCAAKSIYAGAGSLRKARVDLVADAVGLDMTNYWTASGDSYFKSVPKALIAEAIAEVDLDKAKTVDKLKKGEAVALAEEALKDAKWLPVPLRRVTAE
jgi:ParB family transcriptional regulator, chromosome partitioning protein